MIDWKEDWEEVCEKHVWEVYKYKFLSSDKREVIYHCTFCNKEKVVNQIKVKNIINPRSRKSKRYNKNYKYTWNTKRRILG